MLELTKVSTTTGLTDFHFSVPDAEVPWIEKLLKTALKSIERQEPEKNAEKDSYSIEEVFGTIAPGEVLQGYRFRDELTQKQVAEAVGVKQHHISDRACNDFCGLLSEIGRDPFPKFNTEPVQG